MQARPRPILGTLHQAGPQRVTLDVARQHSEVVDLLDGKGLEATLPDVPAGAVMLLAASDVSGQQPVHRAAEIAFIHRPEWQVAMVVHQAKRKNPHGTAKR